MNLFFPLFAVLIWAANTVVNKLAASVIGAAEISFYRWLLAGLLFTPFLLRPVWRNRAVIRAHFGQLLVLSLLGLVIYQSLAYYAAHSTSATSMGIVLSLLPLLTLLLANRMLGTALSAAAWVGTLLSLVGILLVVSQGQPARLLAQPINPGDALMLLATLSYALYGVLLKKWALPLPPTVMLYVQIGITVIMLLPLYLLSPKTGIRPENVGLILFAGIPTSMLAPILWMVGVARLGPARAALTINLLPLFTAMLAVPLLGETLAMHHLIGGGLTLLGVLLSERGKLATVAPEKKLAAV